MEMIEIIEQAIKNEERDMKKYNGLAEESEDSDEKMMFEQLAKDEENHGRILRERLVAIKLLKD